MLRLISLVVFFIFISACESQAQEGDSITFMIVAECKDKAISYFSNLDSREQVNYEYFPFGFTFDSHPEVVGYIKLTSPLKRKNGLEYHAAGIRSLCYSNASKAFSRSDPDYASKVFDIIEFTENRSGKDYYIDVKKDEVIVRWRSLSN